MDSCNDIVSAFVFLDALNKSCLYVVGIIFVLVNINNAPLQTGIRAFLLDYSKGRNIPS